MIHSTSPIHRISYAVSLGLAIVLGAVGCSGSGHRNPEPPDNTPPDGADAGPRPDRPALAGEAGGGGGTGGMPATDGAAPDLPAADKPPSGPDAYIGDTPPPPPIPPVEAEKAAPACKRVVPVTDTATLAAAVAATAAVPGDCIEMADGDYMFPSVITLAATEAAPIVIRAKNLGKATVSMGSIKVTGSAYVVIQGLLFTSGAGTIDFDNCDHCRLTRSFIHPSEPAVPNKDGVDWVAIRGASKDCRIDHNDMGPRKNIGNMVMLAGSGAQISRRTRIDHNFFHDVTRGTGNGWETIRAGLTGYSLSSGFIIIEFNLFKATDGDPETISVKSSDNFIRYNTMRATNGEMTLRLGNRNTLYGNYIFGDPALPETSGIRICGRDHRVFNNYIANVVRPAIFVENGESDALDGAAYHYRVHGVQIAFNTIISNRGILVGGGDPVKQPWGPIDSLIANNLVQSPSQKLYLEGGGPTNTVYTGNIANPMGMGTGGLTKTDAEIRVVDPKLTMVGEVLRLATGSPAIDAAMGTLAFVIDDIEGQPRDKPDVGADEVSKSVALYPGPLTEADVGPMSK